jgi:hypothetical protein
MTYTLRRMDCFILNSTFFGSRLTFDLLFVKIAVLFRNIISLTSVFQHMTSYFRLPKMLLANIGHIYHCLVFVHVHVVCIVTVEHLYIYKLIWGTLVPGHHASSTYILLTIMHTQGYTYPRYIYPTHTYPKYAYPRYIYLGYTYPIYIYLEYVYIRTFTYLRYIFQKK